MFPYNMNFSNFQNTIIFGDAYPTVEEFLNDYHDYLTRAGQANNPPIDDNHARLLYMLLYGQYANSSFANYDLNQAQAKLFGIVFMYGPTWQTRLVIKDELINTFNSRDNENSDFYKGTRSVYNTALNPGTAPSTSDLDALPYINSQNTTNHKKTKMGAMAELQAILKEDVSKVFIDKFAVLFRKVIAPSAPLYYYNDPEDTKI